MHHATPLITTIVGGLVLAFILGMLANKLRISPLVGYLLAGVLAGPFTPGFVADTKLAPELAELGVILLMFGVGLHYSRRDRPDSRGDAAGYGALRRAGLVVNDRYRVRLMSFHRQYRGVTART